MASNSVQNYFNSLKKSGVRLRLTPVKHLLDLLGNPQDQLKCIHVAGTNGKGSVSNYLYSMLHESGFKVGLYTSPHLHNFNERIKVDGHSISDGDLNRFLNVIKPKVAQASKKYKLTFFEVTTALAFLYFLEKKVDFVVLESGMGGRLDATNVINPLLSVITDVSLDHTQYLGSTLRQVAGEKAGIIKNNGLVATSATGVALDVIKETCFERNALLFSINDSTIISNKKSSLLKQSFDLKLFKKNFNLSTKLLGGVQYSNAALAFSSIKLLSKFHNLNLSDNSLVNGLLKAKLPCRFEVVHSKTTVIIDGAHNPSGIKNLMESISKLKYNKLFLVFGCSFSKDYESMVKKLAPKASSVFVVETKLAKPLNASKLESEFNKHKNETHKLPDVKKALKEAISLSNKDDLILVCGSLFVAAEARSLFPN